MRHAYHNTKTLCTFPAPYNASQKLFYRAYTLVSGKSSLTSLVSLLHIKFAPNKPPKPVLLGVPRNNAAQAIPRVLEAT